MYTMNVYFKMKWSALLITRLRHLWHAIHVKHLRSLDTNPSSMHVNSLHEYLHDYIWALCYTASTCCDEVALQLEVNCHQLCNHSYEHRRAYTTCSATQNQVTDECLRALTWPRYEERHEPVQRVLTSCQRLIATCLQPLVPPHASFDDLTKTEFYGLSSPKE